MTPDILLKDVGKPIITYLLPTNPDLAQEVWELVQGGPLGRASTQAIIVYRRIQSAADITIRMSNVVELKVAGR